MRSPATSSPATEAAGTAPAAPWPGGPTSCWFVGQCAGGRALDKLKNPAIACPPVTESDDGGLQETYQATHAR